MTKAFPTSTLNSEPDRDDEVVKRFHRVHYWHIASFRYAVELGRYRGITDSDNQFTRQIHGFTA